MLTLKAFGALDITGDDGAPLRVILTQPKRAALLAYLVLAHPGEFHRRDSLLAMFWPESDQAHGRGALSQALTFLRREVGREVIIRRGSGEVGVVTERVRSDVGAFEAALAEGDWQTALDTYQGELLDGLHVYEAAPFMDWVDRERERLRQAAADAGWRCAQGHIAAGALTQAERAAQRALALVSTDESRVRGFIEALASAGDRAAALRFYEKFAAALMSELEVEPAPETVAVMEAVRARSEPLDVGATATTDGCLAVATGGRADTPSPVGAAPFGAEPSAPDPTPLATVWRRSSNAWRLVAGFGLLGAVILAGYDVVRAGVTGGPGTLIGEGKASRYDQVVVTDFASPDSLLGFAAGELLRSAVDQSDVVRTVSPAAVGAALRRMERDSSLPVEGRTAKEIAVREGCPMVVTAEMVPVGAGYLLTARLEATATGELLGRFGAHAQSAADLWEAVDDLGRALRARIGESRRSIERSPPLERVTTSSLQALLAYSEGVRIRDREGRSREAIPLLERAIELDTTFAAAYRKLGMTLNNLGIERARQLEVARKAYQYRDRLTDGERLTVEDLYALVLTPGGRTSCKTFQWRLGPYENYIRHHPDDPGPLHNYGFWLARLGRYEDAEAAYRRGIDLAGGSSLTYRNLVSTQWHAGERARALRTLEEWRERTGESLDWYLVTSFVRSSSGRYAEADSALDTGEARFGSTRESTELRVYLDAVRGHVTRATQEERALLQSLRSRGHLEAGIRVSSGLALLRVLVQGDTAGALRDADAELVGIPPANVPPEMWIQRGMLHALASDGSDARSYLDTVTALGFGGLSSASALRAAVAVADGRSEAGLVEIEHAIGDCDAPRWAYIVAGRADEALARSDPAIAAYQAYLSAPTPLNSVAVDATFLFDTLERLGRLRETQGDSAQAAAYYARAADLWKDADPELQPRVAWLKERAAALGGAR